MHGILPFIQLYTGRWILGSHNLTSKAMQKVRVQPSMTQLKKNIVANFIGSGWTALMGVVFSPLYIHLMGVEAFGLVGLYITLVSVFFVIGLGLSTSLNRELARCSIDGILSQSTIDLIRTLEGIYWLLSLSAGGAILFLSSWITYQWLPDSNLSKDTVLICLSLIGLITVFHLLAGFYSGGLQGLQKQVQLNVINIVMATLRFGAVVPVLWLVSSSPVAFFVWLLIINILHVFVLAYLLWSEFTGGFLGSSFRFSLLRKIGGFALSTSGVSILGVVLVNIDKIILSKILSLQMFGYYSLASMIAMSLAPRISSPFYVALFPRFTELVGANDTEGLRQLYHHSSQVLSVVLLPISIFICFFSKEILYLWTQDVDVSINSGIILSILSIAYACNGIMYIPYALQLSNYWTKLSFLGNILALIVLMPLIFIFNKYYGVVGVSSSVLVVNVSIVLFSLIIMHRYILKGDFCRWFFDDFSGPVVMSLVISSFVKYFIGFSYTIFVNVVIMLTTLLVMVIFSSLSMPYTRLKFLLLMRRFMIVLKLV
jgi:O-antigen/teichoic acid export membrane protein